MAGSELLKKRKYLLLPWGVILVITAVVFSAHFGVGDVIFPAILGRDTGATWFIAALGHD
jgi:LIVCS family branched-chain amino acid:cation transporter